MPHEKKILDLEMLYLLASSVIGWDNLTECWPAENGVDWEVGHRSEDDETYPVMTIDTANYGAGYDTEKVARFYASLSPAVVLEMVDELKAVRDQGQRFGPVEVVRDDDGYWFHPGIPDFGGDEDPAPYSAWMAKQGLERKGWHLDSDLEDHPYQDGAAHCNGWDPKSPGPEWFLTGIFDTEDGPYVSWARRVTP